MGENKRGIRRSYLNQRFSGSFSGLSGFLKNRKRWNDKKVVEEELQKINAYALHKDIQRKFPRRKVMVNFINEIWSADLKDISNLAKYNNGHTFLLIVVDSFSKRAYVRPIKNKSAEIVIKAFKSILREAGAKPIYLFTDRGTEFLSAKFKHMLKENKIKPYYIYSSKKASIAERYIRTLFSKLQRYMTERKTNKFVDKLQDFVHTLNNTYHRTIGRAPSAGKPEDTYEIWERMYGDYIKEQSNHKSGPKYKVGNLVRISKAKLKFAKGKVINIQLVK